MSAHASMHQARKTLALNFTWKAGGPVEWKD